MALDYILRRVRSETGMTEENQRAYLVDKINEAADELWESKDLPVVLKECCVRANSDRQLALPAFVGELRAIRGACSDDIDYHARFSLKDIRPKYVETEWKRLWNNWRIIGEAPTCIEITETAPGEVIVEEADDELEITITGSTASSNRVSEVITMTSGTMEWTKSFMDIVSIRKNKTSETDVLINDAAGNELSIIYSDQLEAKFLIVDISRYPYSGHCQCPDGSYVTEVLYKPRRPHFQEDTDVFPLVGYDDVIVLKTKQLLAEEEEGKETRALLMHEKAKMLIDQKVQDKTSVTKKGLTWGRNPLMQHRKLYNCWHSGYRNSTYRDC